MVVKLAFRGLRPWLTKWPIKPPRLQLRATDVVNIYLKGMRLAYAPSISIDKQNPSYCALSVQRAAADLLAIADALLWHPCQTSRVDAPGPPESALLEVMLDGLR
jgi:hypothetical protein